MSYRSDMGVRLVRKMGDDLSIVEDARTSLRAPGKALKTPTEISDRHRELLRDFFRLGHASTLRGCALTVELEVPLFVQRELRTHWVGNHQLWDNDVLGFNDQSGRYRKYEPVFWLPNRPFLEAEGFDPMTPRFKEGGDEHLLRDEMWKSYVIAWETYERLLEKGVAREVARGVLPQAIYVAGRMTMNLNAAFGLLSMRIAHPLNSRETYPQREIEEVALKLEAIVQEGWPEAHQAWQDVGRTRP